MLFTTLLISSARFIGSFADSLRSNCVLNRMKSTSLAVINVLKSVALCLRANESGSSPLGNRTTLTLSPSSKSISIPRKEASIPAESPSYRTVIFSVNRWINRICPGVSAVPDEETTFSTPA